VWPPLRVFRVLRAWQLTPVRAGELVRRHRPTAKFVLAGHTHRPGIWQTPAGVTMINTGSFCPPLGGYAVDLFDHRLAVRRIEPRGGEFRLGETIAEFALATG
jgi:hypothetical protein